MKTDAKHIIVLLVFSLLVLAIMLQGCAVQEEAAVSSQIPEEMDVQSEQEELGPINMLSVSVFQFGYSPEVLEAEYGDRVVLTVTSLDVGHGFALPDFGVNERVPAEESIEIRFIADRRGEFEFFNSVYSGSGWKDMKGKFIVN